MTLQAENITKCYGETVVLNDISLKVSQGETVAICGRSGEGKTTLLHILGTLEQPDSGTIKIGNTQVSKQNIPRIRNQSLGFIFQSYNLLEDFTALENVLMPSLIARAPMTKEQGMHLLSLVGLEQKAELQAKVLSGGERQRVAIARALCNNPSIILADEPTGNLDRANAEHIGKILISLNKSLIIVTHDTHLASLCSTRYTLANGKLHS